MTGGKKNADQGAGSGLSILIVRLSALGDLVHTLPLVRMLRRAFPGARIDWLVQDRLACIVQAEPAVDNVITLDRGRLRTDPMATLKELSTELKANGYTHAIDVQGLAKSSVMSLLSGASIRLGFEARNSREGSWLINNRGVRCHLLGDHVVAMNLCLGAGLGVAPLDREISRQQPLAPWIDTLPETRMEGLEILRRAFGPGVDENICPPWSLQTLKNFARGVEPQRRWPRPGGLCLISPGAGWPTKVWPAQYYAELACWLTNQVGMRVGVLWAGEMERAMALEIAQGSGAQVLEPTTIPAMCALLEIADLFIGGDTGPMHIANFQGTPCVALHLASDSLRNGPWFGGSLVVTPDLPCHPCMKRACDDPVCLRSISPKRVMDSIQGRFFSGQEGAKR